jgi:hypothetical protein
MKNDPTESTPEIKHRVIIPIQTRGNIGKSTEAVARCEWMLQRGITWTGYDLDPFNRTLSNTYPGSVQFVEPGDEPESAIINVLRDITQAEVTLIDPRAHLDQVILEALRKVRFAEIARGAQARLTVVLFPIDELSDMDGISHTVELLNLHADWVVVRNPAKIRATKFFDGSELEATLRAYGAASLQIPPLLSDTRNHLRALEIQLGHGFSPTEALKNPELKVNLFHRMILEDWLQDMFRRFDAIAGHLLPIAAARAINVKPDSAPEIPRRRGAGVNVTNIL